ncbi:hypothetical protein V5E97_07310 [Singulisphaera sp. Ch08]|uniref:SLA1 homology domain-containing protein n=1 Tax=Singulisphaera sp. Ch08 TaxID=3120278 RepID=A0AAU7CLC9_9BACT
MREVPLLVFVGVVLTTMPFLAGAGHEKVAATEVDGTWRLTRYIENGKPNEEEVRANFLIVRKNGIQEITRGGTFFSKRKITIDPLKTPKQIDLVDDAGVCVVGIYEMGVDGMRLAILADPEKRKTERPSNLKDEGNIVAVYQRVQDKVQDAKEEGSNPQSVDDGQVRLEKLLGRFLKNNNRQWRFVYDDETQMTPESGKPIIVVRKGIMTYGVPVRSGDLITFDSIESLQRTIYDSSEGGKRTLSRELQNHSTMRYYLRRSLSGDWFFDTIMLSHSDPEFRDRPYFRGRVNWLADGIELVGLGTDNFFRQGGELFPGAFLSRRKLKQEGNRLVQTIRHQGYQLAKGPEGDILPIPDFSQPVGELFNSELKSEPILPD